MVLQAILSRSGYAVPTERLVIELELDGAYLEVILDGRPSVTARPSTDPDARVRATVDELSSFLDNPALADGVFTHVSGDEGATHHLVAAMAGFDSGGA